ncbi:hypothetical protein K458DRAFT_399137 [Lentithecium fluviatile CBS 122367]|uniref:Protein HRI1 n=1 Tax=Lentithecium fluviatile CBS 122367 TaxID=1168545 RepID=A0A6G1JKZ0_9PLEO|nr:hypothetical protein K458DRAFT_399137 [Lentithecium fluviatile CBS 122367]
MASTTPQTPHIDIVLSFDPPSHSFSQATPPNLTLTLTSHAETPFTLFTWSTTLALPNALTTSGITITDAAAGRAVQTASLTANRAPLKRTKGTSDEKYFITLQPNTQLQLSTGFGRGGSVKPQPKAVVERGWELDENGDERKIRRSKFATGVDGLEPGHEYVIGLDEGALKSVWWVQVAKEEVLVEGSAEGSYVQDYEWEKIPLNFHVEEAELKVEQCFDAH